MVAVEALDVTSIISPGRARCPGIRHDMSSYLRSEHCPAFSWSDLNNKMLKDEVDRYKENNTQIYSDKNFAGFIPKKKKNVRDAGSGYLNRSILLC